MPPPVETTIAWIRSPADTSTLPSASFSSARSISASPLPPTSTKATSAPNPTMVPSMVWPRVNCRGLRDASNIAAKSSSCSLMACSSLPGSDDFDCCARFRELYLVYTSVAAQAAGGTMRRSSGNANSPRLIGATLLLGALAFAAGRQPDAFAAGQGRSPDNVVLEGLRAASILDWRGEQQRIGYANIEKLTATNVIRSAAQASALPE